MASNWFRARKDLQSDAVASVKRLDDALNQFHATPKGRAPFEQGVRCVLLQTGRFAARTRLLLAQNPLRQNASHHEDRPWS